MRWPQHRDVNAVNSATVLLHALEGSTLRSSFIEQQHVADDRRWVSIPAHQPRDRQLVYARLERGLPKKVTFHARPTPRWEGANIGYEFQYFAEWAALDTGRKPPVRSE
jgi:hypothetical protein